mgnify:CR=1 FL=1
MSLRRSRSRCSRSPDSCSASSSEVLLGPGREPPRLTKRLALEDPEDDLGVADIGCEEHGVPSVHDLEASDRLGSQVSAIVAETWGADNPAAHPMGAGSSRLSISRRREAGRHDRARRRVDRGGPRRTSPRRPPPRSRAGRAGRRRSRGPSTPRGPAASRSPARARSAASVSAEEQAARLLRAPRA